MRIFLEVARVAEMHPDRVALETHRGGEPVQITYAELIDLAWRDAGRLVNMGIARGATVALSDEDRPEWLRSYLALSATGAGSVGFADDGGDEEVRATVESARPIAVIAPAATLARLSVGLRAQLDAAGVALLDLDRDLAVYSDPPPAVTA